MPLSIVLWMLTGAGLTLLLLWAGSRLRHWVRRERYGDTAQLDEQLSRYYHQMASNVEDRHALRRLLTDEIPQALGIGRAALLLLGDHELVGGNELRLAVNNLAVRQVAASGSASPVDPGLRRLLQQNRIDLTWTAVWVPLLRGANLHGLWLLGERSDRRAFTASQLQALTTLARQAALILETVQVAQRAQGVAQQLQALYHQAVSASEVERSRLARELHDSVLQEICAMTRDLKVLEKRDDPPLRQLEALIRSANEAVSTLRLICHNLRPPLLASNLPLALQALVERVSSHATAHISFTSSVAGLTLPEETTLAIYRIAQEALNNAMQHAAASEIQMRLTQHPAMLRLTVSDDGRGMVANEDHGQWVATGHFGLASMRERAKIIHATLEIHSAREYGTAVILQAPINLG